jgi:tripartite-type tricarboxylate transporter receptor subunit TctC
MPAIANAVSAAAVLFSYKTSGVKTFEDLRTKDLVIGAMTKTGDTYVIPAAVKKILGLEKFRIVTGYPGTREVVMAIERGEVQGRVWYMEGLKGIRPHWLEDGSVNLLAQLAPQRMPEVPAHVPSVMDFITNDEDRRALDVIFLPTLLARPYITTPGVPPERLVALRKAFMATLMDKDFLAEMERAQMGITPMSGEDMERRTKAAYDQPEAIVKRVRNILAE